ncbi:MAG: dTDP-4-dehydrorhamnose reductase [Methanomicrobiales archaeon]|nr:dTDP-4-dehydrorhamnose reductase [Methanomicrobiales archaeon]
MVEAPQEVNEEETQDAEVILVLGANGMLGHAFRSVLRKAVFCGRQLDITKQDQISLYFNKLRPAIVINCAAYTDVEGSEDHRDYAMLVNGIAPGYLAEACEQIGAVLVHFSTDYVFDGTEQEYQEDDIPHPINVYGESKLLGEQNVMKRMDDYRIIRTSWLFGPYGKNFVDTMIDLSRKTEQVKVVNDQFGKPTYTNDLAQKTPEIVKKNPGIYHLTNDGVCSWYEFARAIIPNAIPCTTEEFPRKARRPKYSVLVNTKTDSLRLWRDALADYLKMKGREVHT